MEDSKQWDLFGYETENGCDICGEKPAKIEPHFGYKTCLKHSKLSPVDFSREKGDTN